VNGPVELHMNYPLPRRIVAEALGTAMLLAAVVGSGIMGERLAACNNAICAVGKYSCYWSSVRLRFASSEIIQRQH